MNLSSRLSSLRFALALSVLAAFVLVLVPGCKVNSTGAGGGPPEHPELADPLYEAIIAGDEELALSILEDGAPPNWEYDRGVTVLHYACRATMPNLTRRLLEKGARVDATYEGGIQPIHWAARAGASDREGAEETIDVLIEFGADINARTAAGTLPIEYAIQLGNQRWMDFLIDRGSMTE